MLNWFLRAIDLSDNLEAALEAIRPLRGLNAIATGVAFLLISAGLVPLVWYFDIGATIEWGQTTWYLILPSLPHSVAVWASVILLALTMLPSIIELFGAKLARAGIIVAQGAVYGFSLFDAVTDFPRVAAFMESYRHLFDAFGPFAFLAFLAGRIGMLFMASFGFEMLLIISSICGVVLLIVGMKKEAHAGRRA
jgi:hypothetical protein